MSFKIPFPFEIKSNQKPGHLLFDDPSWPESTSLSCDTLIVGAGIAGLSAALALSGNDVIICEINDSIAGTAGAIQHGQGYFGIGAHYDIPYPEFYGRQVPEFLEKIGLMTFDDQDRVWHFTDKHYYINEEKQEKCLLNTEFHEDVIAPSKAKRFFEKSMYDFEGVMVMPTLDIPKKYHYLNSMTFKEFLLQEKISHKLFSGIDYKMRDDYGADSNQISALAGIHYYSCRPEEELGTVFSPPQGNYYFADKFAQHLAPETLKTNHLVRRIEKTEQGGYIAEVLDLKQQVTLKIQSRSIIYAGMKPALQKVYPAAYPLFKSNIYSAWMSVQFVMNKTFDQPAFWQNEILIEDIETPFMGFVDSAAQYQQSNSPRVLTAYYCFKPEERQILMDIEQHAPRYIQDALDLMELYFKETVGQSIEKAQVYTHGHAMPVPAPHFLLNDRNSSIIAQQGFFFAGVDNGRLPLLYEAIDSGLSAAECVKSYSYKKH